MPFKCSVPASTRRLYGAIADSRFWQQQSLYFQFINREKCRIFAGKIISYAPKFIFK
jgi:hypothetical protein